MMSAQDYYEWMWLERNVEKPCQDCNGSGIKTYGNTATWKGSVGGQTPTSATCNRCWGTGDEDRRGTSFHEIERWKAAYDEKMGAK